MLLFALFACTAPSSDTDGADTSADTAEPEPTSIPCGIDDPIPGWWGGILVGVRAPAEGCDRGDEEPCALADGHSVVAEAFATNTKEWAQGYDHIQNDADDETITYVQVRPSNAAFSECRITLY
jgi:hypothetical protein